MEASSCLHYALRPITRLPAEILVQIMAKAWASMVKGILIVDNKAYCHILEFGDAVQAYDVVLAVDQTSGACTVQPTTPVSLTALRHKLLEIRLVSKSFRGAMEDAIWSGPVVFQHIERSPAGLRQVWFVPQLSKQKVTAQKLVALSTAVPRIFDFLMYPLTVPLNKSGLNLGPAYSMGMSNLKYVSQDDTKNANQHSLVRKDGHFWVRGTIIAGGFQNSAIVLSIYMNKTLGVYIMLKLPRRNDLQAQEYSIRLGSFGSGWATFA
jgi:hypothetical protein